MNWDEWLEDALVSAIDSFGEWQQAVDSVLAHVAAVLIIAWSLPFLLLFILMRFVILTPAYLLRRLIWRRGSD